MQGRSEIGECYVLDEASMEKYIGQILQIENDTSIRLGTHKYGKAWTRDNFLSDRDGKWVFSQVVVKATEVQAYLISSKWSNNLHGHRMSMQADLQTSDKVKLQNMLYENQQEIAKRDNIFMTTAMVPAENVSTIRYYLKAGWSELDAEELVEFIEGRNMACFVEAPNVLVDKVPEEGHPSRAKVLKYLTK